MRVHQIAADRVLPGLAVGTTLVAGFLYLAYGLWMTILPIDANLSVRLGHPAWAGHDALVFFGAARLIDAGDLVGAYDLARIRQVYSVILGGRAPPIPWAYPPVLAAFVQPFAWMTPVAAVLVYFSVMFGAALLTARVVAGRWRVAAVALGLPCVAHTLVVGQNGALTALLLGCGFAWWRTAPLAAGVALGLLAYKPHFLVLPAVLALVLGNRQVLAGMIVTVAALVGLSVALYGIEPWLAWLPASSRQFSYLASGDLPLPRVISVYGFVLYATGRVSLSLAVHAMFAIAAALLVVEVWRRADDPMLRVVTLAVGCVFVTPYAFDYDLAVLAVPLAVVLARIWGSPTIASVDLRWFVLLGLGPFVTAVLSLAVEWQFGAFMLAAALIAAARSAECRFNPFPRMAAA